MNNKNITPSNMFSGHKVNHESVVPGAYFVLQASRNNKHNTGAQYLQNVEFPALCFAQDFVDTDVEYQAEYASVILTHSGQPALKANLLPFPLTDGEVRPWSTEQSVQAQEQYEQLSYVGNTFLDNYRCVNFVKAVPDECIISHQEDLSETELLDACIHSLLIKNSELVKSTMVLKGIEQVWLSNQTLQAPLKVCFDNTVHTNATLTSDLCVYAQNGTLVCQLNGIVFTALDSKATQMVNVGGSFTLQPIAEALNALTSDSSLHVGTELYEYRHWQHFLLEPAIQSTSSLANVLILRPEDLIKRSPLDNEPNDLTTHSLPNGMEVAQINIYETDYLYKEIFLDRCYARNGVVIEDNDIVLDVGANIGMFSLYAINQANNVTVHAFEPSPMAAQCLASNVSGRGNVHVYQSGVSGHHGQACFTFYPKTSVFSGFFTDDEADFEAVRHVIYNQVKHITSSEDEVFLSELTEQMLSDRLEKQDIDCDLIGLSAFIEEQKIEKIGLLKIDAEKAELGILQAMTTEDFAKVRQICLEVHDEIGDNLKAAVTILEQNGFSVLVEVESELSNTGLYTVTAKRIAHEANTSQRTPCEKYGVELDLSTLEQALATYTSQSNVPLTVIIAPTQAKEPLAAELRAWCLKQTNQKNLQFVLPENLTADYPQLKAFSENIVAEAMIPFSQDWYAAAASCSLKYLSITQKQPHKVIVVDADNTLWHGVVGEVGVQGLEVHAQHKALQSRLLKQKAQGVLLALCSKNIEKDVVTALEQHPDMLLSSDDFIVKKVNWQAKSENITEIEDALSLSANSFIFIDDNEAECAEVAAQHPETLCLLFPSDESSATRLISQHWVFNEFEGNAFDAKRHQLYIDQGQRSTALKSSKSYADFIKDLGVEVQIAPVGEAQLERVSQLTSRTNQFNANKRSYSVNELIHKQQDEEILTLHAADKFGDYGLVGVALYQLQGATCLVENILLSCRALNKGIEHRFLRMIAQSALDNGCDEVHLQWQVTERNLPLRNFYGDIAKTFTQVPMKSPLCIEAVSLASLEFDPQTRSYEQTEPGNVKLEADNQGLPLRVLDALYMRSVDLDLLVEHAWPGFDSADIRIVGATSLQQTLAEIWGSVLGVAPNSLDDEFTSLGGRSLLLVRVLELIYQKFGVKLSLFDGIKYNALRTLAEKVEQEINGGASPQVCDTACDVDIPDISPTLQGLYFASLLNPSTSAYTVPILLSIDEVIVSDLLANAVQKIIVASPNLSTGYKQVGRDTKAAQIENTLQVESHDIETWTQGDIDGYLEKAAQRPVNIKTGPLVHLHVLCGKDSTLVLLVTHHLAVDLQSMELLLNNLKQVLSGQSIGEPLGVQRAFTQRIVSLEQSFIDEAMAHWQSRLSDAPILSLPVTDNAERQGLMGKGFTVSLSLESSITIKEKMQRSGQSDYVFLLAAYFQFLNNYSGDSKVVIGTPVSLRQGDEHQCIGNFVNQVPVVMQFNEDKTWAQLLEQTSKEVYASLQYREIPFLKLVKEFCDQPPSGRAGLTQTTFALHQPLASQSHIEYAFVPNEQSPQFSLGPYKAALKGMVQQCGQVDIAVECLEIRGRLHINIKYDTQLITEQDAVHFANKFISSLESL
ncbi:FkbM family methyltransferase [Pseudoalteromonas aurantia]|uniref:Carrier domain-containing protein n=1 Tax=Pseudoalteromonas aurantia TaxID=43654 RepID=A0ABY2VY16_9GAMM|nr:FkbM family methyltransferase [Pseudoalteromonas aurantia]TMO74720.1 hypothetical protein CWC20_09340 [Pseudoalteromonas aurantia]